MDYFGNTYSERNRNFRLNSLESNVPNFSMAKDMELTTTFYGVNNSNPNFNIYSLSFSKKVGLHNFYFRYTPGITQQFVVKSGMNVQLPDSISELKTNLKYEEKYGLGYSYRLSSFFTIGFSFRYFNQIFNEEKPILFVTDSINYLSIRNEITRNNFWRGDFGLTYSPSGKFILSVFSHNLILIQETEQNELTRLYSLKNEKGLTTIVSFSPVEKINLLYGYETNNSFYAGINYSTKIPGGSITLGSLIFHDKFQNPFWGGILPSINYSTNLFSITLSGIKYFSKRTNQALLNEMIQNGLNNISNNRYSYDKVYLAFNFALSFTKDQQIKFVDVEIKNSIYPTLIDIYLEKPFAVGKVLNLTNKKLDIRPYCLIKKINDEFIYSPTVTINPFDTIEVPFYIFVKNDNMINNREISTAEFYVSIDDLEPEDRIQKPILINDKNSWDGNVSNLSYFVRSDFDFSRTYSNNVLKNYKEQLDTVDFRLLTFYKIKIIFENFIKEMNYVADPRASTEHVQFPNETIKLKGGDCDDLSVCLASLLESIGIQTAFVDYKNDSGVNHVNLLINTNLLPEQMNLITKNDSKIFIRKNTEGIDEIWLPVETTSFKDFETSWATAAEKFNKEALENYGLAKGKVVIVDIN